MFATIKAHPVTAAAAAQVTLSALAGAVGYRVGGIKMASWMIATSAVAFAAGAQCVVSIATIGTKN